MEKISTNSVLMVAIIPYFLEKEFVWFIENSLQIARSIKTQGFWQNNTLFLEQNQKVSLSEVLRKIDELGYEKVFKTSEPGEFSQIGGVIDIFPINSPAAFRLDFLGNFLEKIEQLPLRVANEEIAKKLLHKKLKSQKTFSDIKNLKPGDYLVHLDHGIAQFRGIGNFQFSIFNFQSNPNDEISKQEKQYYVLEYTQDDKLYVPVGLERKLSRYIGFSEPKLSRLGGVLWQKTKRKIKEKAEKLARELLAMFAEKAASQRPTYPRDEFTQTLEENFPYELTIDQKQVLGEIAADLAKPAPMDRVVCGDVGFGKTEIALRAAVKVAENNRQAALICPTAILASQHFITFKNRLKNLPLNIALLSRLQPASQQRKIIAGLKAGEIDIVIGTHCLLAKNLQFKNLGLLIIDDEQKFGVKQKEKLRQSHPALDVLYLSATPIPRTLYMALSSLKEISFIQTPPAGRKAIKTIVAPFKKETAQKAIEQELSRGGQIYFLHNRVENIGTVKQYLVDLKTKAQIAILHAKLPDQEIISIMDDFQKGGRDRY